MPTGTSAAGARRRRNDQGPLRPGRPRQASEGSEDAVATAEHSPLEQFEIHAILPITVGDLDLSFTNSSLWMAIAVR